MQARRKGFYAEPKVYASRRKAYAEPKANASREKGVWKPSIDVWVVKNMINHYRKMAKFEIPPFAFKQRGPRTMDEMEGESRVRGCSERGDQ